MELSPRHDSIHANTLQARLLLQLTAAAVLAGLWRVRFADVLRGVVSSTPPVFWRSAVVVL